MTDSQHAEFIILNHSYEGYGMVMDMLSRTPPFSKMEIGELSAAVRLQLARDHHIAAVAGSRLLGYVGWLPTTKAIADTWVRNQGLLLPALDSSSDAIALTIIAAARHDITLTLIKGIRTKNPGVRIYFKRTGTAGKDRKTSVLNRR